MTSLWAAVDEVARIVSDSPVLRRYFEALEGVGISRRPPRLIEALTDTLKEAEPVSPGSGPAARSRRSSAPSREGLARLFRADAPARVQPLLFALVPLPDDLGNGEGAEELALWEQACCVADATLLLAEYLRASMPGQGTAPLATISRVYAQLPEPIPDPLIIRQLAVAHPERAGLNDAAPAAVGEAELASAFRLPDAERLSSTLRAVVEAMGVSGEWRALAAALGRVDDSGHLIGRRGATVSVSPRGIQIRNTGAGAGETAWWHPAESARKQLEARVIDAFRWPDRADGESRETEDPLHHLHRLFTAAEAVISRAVGLLSHRAMIGAPLQYGHVDQIEWTAPDGDSCRRVALMVRNRGMTPWPSTGGLAEVPAEADGLRGFMLVEQKNLSMKMSEESGHYDVECRVTLHGPLLRP